MLIHMPKTIRNFNNHGPDLSPETYRGGNHKIQKFLFRVIHQVVSGLGDGSVGKVLVMPTHARMHYSNIHALLP